MSEVKGVLSNAVRVRQIVANYLSKVEGRVKTFVEAMTEDADQCHARKVIVGNMVWSESEYLLDHIDELFSGGDHGEAE